MAQYKAATEDWRAYYQAADRLRMVAGDPYERYAEQKRGRERMLLVASCVFMAAIFAAFIAMT